jgi:hypothetical protein
VENIDNSGDPLQLTLNGQQLTGDPAPQPASGQSMADFLRDRINSDEQLQGLGIRASSDGNALTVRSSRGDDLQLTVSGNGSSLDLNGQTQAIGATAEDFTVGGRVDVQLASDMRLFSDEPNGLFGGAPEAKSNYVGYQVTLGSGTGEQGQPAAGDRLFVEYNSGGSADNRNAAAMLELNTTGTLGNGNLTYQQAYGQLVEDVGIQTSQARQSQQASESMLRQSMDAGWLKAEQRWTLSHLESSIDMLERGLGFAWIPETRISEALEKGYLVALPLVAGGIREAPIQLIYRDRDRAGPATHAMASALKDAVSRSHVDSSFDKIE